MTRNVPLRVEATEKALDLIGALRREHGEILFHQSGGCCDGSSPMCYAVGEYMISDADVKLGEVGGAGFYMSPSQFEYWKHTHLTLDVVPGRGGMFSLENGREVRFHIRSRIFTDHEVRALEDAAA
ncbi:MAG: DUF779 domain-containing protein [Ancylobacter novellus]|uniref:DUF779 domain-containing protein n=1 Tax=Ancylobacter novellus TaxID=921 RepID=A0A2W5KDP0_ANCNO|nr:MAG: DUF779 domain-containing protein [Ancylobacter novellus]